MTTVKLAALALLGLVILAALILGGWQAGWWFTTQNTSRQGQVFQASYGAQTADIQQAENLASEIASIRAEIASIRAEIASTSIPAAEATQLQAQATAETTQACNLIAEITSLPVPAPLASFSAASCQS